MADVAFVAVITNVVLGIACAAMSWGLVLVGRRYSRQAFARARHAATIFLVAAAATFFVNAAGVATASPRPDLDTALRAITAVAGLVTAVQLVAIASSPASPASTRNATGNGGTISPSSTLAEEAAVDTVDVAPSARDHDGPAATSELGSPEANFLGLVSHELRTPLTAMQLLLDRLSDAGEELAPRQRKIVDRLSSTAARLTDLVDSILYYARIRSGRLIANVEPFDLNGLAMDITDELRPQAQRKSLDLETKTTRERISIESDPKLLRLVLVNLVSNALKFTEHGKVAVSVSLEGDRRIVRVTDSGAGIAPDEQKRIFEPFQSAEPTKHKHLPGVGLGLSLARQIVDNLGGHIAVHSELGKGSTFEVYLPAIRSQPRSV